MSETLTFHPVKFIEEVKARPGLYDPAHPMDRAERLELWKQVGAALFTDWDSYSKATAYDRGETNHASIQMSNLDQLKTSGLTLCVGDKPLGKKFDNSK